MSRSPAVGAAWPRHLRSRRLLLRSISPDEPRPDWLEEAETALLGDGRSCPLRGRAAADEVAYWLRPAGTAPDDALGACAARLERDGLIWTWLAVAADRRAFGYGGAAVPIVERAALRMGATMGRVAVPKDNGIALYFWLRLGYRPDCTASWALPGALTESEAGGTWMTRELSDRDRPARPPR